MQKLHYSELLGGQGVIHYFDGNDVRFNFDIESSETREEVPTEWRPEYTIQDDGSVYDEIGELVGYVRIAKSKPTTHPKDYDLNNIVIYKGQMLLTEDLTPYNADNILDELENYNS